MRIRKKPWARSELESVVFFEQHPKDFIGNWASRFAERLPICLELGCGKGFFIANLASENPNVNYIGIDIKDEMLVLAKRNIEREFFIRKHDINNVVLLAYDISRISDIFSKDDVVGRIYINFCNPWPRNKHKKRRLTHIKQLNQYKTFLIDGGEIYFKTDDDDLFNDSIKYFEACKFEVTFKTDNLELSNFSDNIETEHEKMFRSIGKSIKFLIAKKR